MCSMPCPAWSKIHRVIPPLSRDDPMSALLPVQSPRFGYTAMALSFFSSRKKLDIISFDEARM